MQQIDESRFINKDDLAHYYLLKVQVSYLVNEVLAASDSLLDVVISHYETSNDNEKLADAYYYKGIGFCKRKDFQNGIIDYKKAEQYAKKGNYFRQQYKIAEGISFINRIYANYNVQLQYAQEALSLAKLIDNKKWLAYSYYWISSAYYNMEKDDSVLFYLGKMQPYVKYVDEKNRAIFLSNIGFMLRDNNPAEAIKYLEASLKYKELTNTYEYLAEIYYDEGDKEKAYGLRKKALSVQDATPKDDILHNIIEYDIEHGKTDSICEMVTQIIAIRDSIDSRLKDDTIKDLQTRFDHEVAMHEEIIKWQWRLFAVVLLVIVLVGYMVWRRYKASILLRTHQMEIQNHLNEIDNLKSSGEDTSKEVEALNNEIKRIMDEKSPRLNEGRILYDRIVANEKMSRWKKADEKKFIEYYTATHYKTINRIKKVPRKHELTTHQLFYLILVEMGKTDLEILIILSITKEALRTLRHRTQPLENG